VKGMVIRIVATAATFFVLPIILPQYVDFAAGWLQLAIVAVLFGLANGLVKPLVKLLSFPINMLTLGLFGLVINIAMVLGVAWVADTFFKTGLVIGGFPTEGLSVDAIVGAFIVGIALSVVQTIAGLLVKD
jgi:putative membrane protein